MPVKLATTTSVFGAALASMLVAPELQADVVSLTFYPATHFFYGNESESLHVPSPGALALLALGAVGIRRKRKRAA